MNIFIKNKLDELLSKNFLKNNEILELISELKENNMTFNNIIDIKYLKETDNRFDFEDEDFDGELKDEEIEQFLKNFGKYLTPIKLETIDLYNDNSKILLYQFNIKKLNEYIINNKITFKNTIKQIINKYKLNDEYIDELIGNLNIKEEFKLSFELQHNLENEKEILSEDSVIDMTNLLNEITKDFKDSQNQLLLNINNNRLLNSKVGIDMPIFNKM